ncbi:hypothetical protein HI914_01675 [Erysiphe necator]|nr:hypothetical protein HI914_01675 [Erysiphe necator]
MEPIDTEFEDDSEVEDLSPSLSLGSTTRRSDTTISSLHELCTPNFDSNGFCKLNFDVTKPKPVEGPWGMHLFRGSVDSSSVATEPDAIENYYLKISPATPTTIDFQKFHRSKIETLNRPLSHPFFDLSIDPVDSMILSDIACWTPRHVSRWMHHVGFDILIAEKFEKNDISGAILLTLKFEDLNELDISSFRLRKKIWNEVENLRYSNYKSFEKSSSLDRSVKSIDEELFTLSEENKSHQLEASYTNLINVSKCGINQVDVILPSCIKSGSLSKLDSEIENTIVMEDRNTKVDDISKREGQELLIENFYGQSNPKNSSEPFGKNHTVKEFLSSPDIHKSSFSANEPSSIYDNQVQEKNSKHTLSQLEEANLRLINLRDPQENVKQFIESQSLSMKTGENYLKQKTNQELQSQAPKNENLNNFLAKPQVLDYVRSSATFSPYQMERVAAISPELQNVVQPQLASSRFGVYIPNTDISLSIRHAQLGAVARNVCHSILKNFMKSSFHISRIRYSPSKVVPEVSEDKVDVLENVTADHVTQAGWMRKRKTKILRFDWQNYYFSLKGTQLAMHKNEHECLFDAIEYIDIDDYAIVCSSFATSSKFHAAFRAMSISRKEEQQKNTAPFVFQLVPASVKKGGRLNTCRKIKAHYFAVQSQNERSDWMREIMLAKAMHKKKQGYKVNVNGNVT